MYIVTTGIYFGLVFWIEIMSNAVVIVIGDDSQFIYLMQSYIRKSGYRMRLVAQNRPDLLNFIQKIDPILIVFDADCKWNQTGNLLDAVKTSLIPEHIPFVVCSWIESETGLSGEHNEFHLSKPVIYGDFQYILAQIGSVQDVQ